MFYYFGKRYFLSTEESVKAKLFTALSSADKERITIVETGFKNNISAAQIAAELNATTFENEIKKHPKINYYLFDMFPDSVSDSPTIACALPCSASSPKTKMRCNSCGSASSTSHMQTLLFLT